jgi:hypothetical protein
LGLDAARRFENSLSREQLLEANAVLIRRNKQLERGIMQEYVDLANKVIEGFMTIVIDANNGNLDARENMEKFLDALRVAQGKPVALPHVIETPTGPVVVEAENKSDAIPDPILEEGPDTEPPDEQKELHA